MYSVECLSRYWPVSICTCRVIHVKESLAKRQTLLWRALLFIHCCNNPPFLYIYIFYISLRYFPLNYYYYFEGSFLSAKISLHNWFHRPTFCTKDYVCECFTFLYELHSLLFLFTHSGCVPPSAFKETWHRRQTKHLTWLSNFFPQNLRIYSFWVSFDVSDRAFQGLFFSSCFKVSTGYLRHAVCKLYWQAAVNVSKVNLAWVQIW